MAPEHIHLRVAEARDQRRAGGVGIWLPLSYAV
jgi:hypothetical protein